MKENKKYNSSADIALEVVNLFVLFGALVAVMPVDNWVYMALICVLMLVQLGVMGFHIAQRRAKDDGKDSGKDNKK